MMSSRLAWLVTGAGVAAAWAAARFAGFAPLLWAVLLVTVLVLPANERRVVDRRWLFAGLVLLGVSWVVASDHELAFAHSLLAVAAVLLFAIARRAAPSDRLVGLLALGVALTSIVALGQALGGLERARALLGTLPPAWHEAATIRLAGGRAFGTSALPGHFAALLLLAVPLVVERGWRSSRWRWAASRWCRRRCSCCWC